MKLFVFLVIGLSSFYANADYWFVEVKEQDAPRFLELVPEQDRVLVQQTEGASLRPQIQPIQLFQSYSATKYIIQSDDVSALTQIPGLKLTKVGNIMTSFSAERISDRNGWGEVSSGSPISRLELKVDSGPLTVELAESIREALQDPLAAFRKLHPAEFNSVGGLEPLSSSEGGFEVKVFFNVYLLDQDVHLFRIRIPRLKGSLQAFSAHGISGYLQTVVMEEDGPCEVLVSRQPWIQKMWNWIVKPSGGSEKRT